MVSSRYGYLFSQNQIIFHVTVKFFVKHEFGMNMAMFSRFLGPNFNDAHALVLGYIEITTNK